MTQTDSRQRFLDICHCKRPGDHMILGEELHAFWPDTLEAWAAEGAISAEETMGSSGRGIYDSLGLDEIKFIREINSGLCSDEVLINFHGTSFITDPFLVSPAFDLCVLEEDDLSLTFSNAAGQTERVLKNQPWNMPQILDWPVKDWPSWRRLQERLDPGSPERWPTDWATFVRSTNALTCPVGMGLGGFFALPNQWVGTQRLMYMFHDDPDLVHAMMDRVLELELAMVDRVTRDVRLDFIYQWEDMAYRAGPMISPGMVRELMMPRYAALNELIHGRGIDVIMMDSDGNVELLIPLWIEAGFNFLLPLEVAAGMDPLKLRKEYGKDLILCGGIDKRVLALDQDAIRNELLSKVPPLIEEGGYFATPDHLVPPDVSYENFCYYLQVLRDLEKGVSSDDTFGRT